MNQKTIQYIHSGKFAAAVDVDRIDDDGAWGPYLSVEDALKVERVRLALDRGDIAAASREARVFEMLPISA